MNSASVNGFEKIASFEYVTHTFFPLLGSEVLSNKYVSCFRAKCKSEAMLWEKNAYLLLNKHRDLPFFLSNCDLPFIIFLFKELEKIMCFKTDLLLEMCYSRPVR